jgi:hypothetical protein
VEARCVARRVERRVAQRGAPVTSRSRQLPLLGGVLSLIGHLAAARQPTRAVTRGGQELLRIRARKHMSGNSALLRTAQARADHDCLARDPDRPCDARFEIRWPFCSPAVQLLRGERSTGPHRATQARASGSETWRLENLALRRGPRRTHSLDPHRRAGGSAALRHGRPPAVARRRPRAVDARTTPRSGA